MSAEFVRVPETEKMPGCRIAVGGCYGPDHQIVRFDGANDDVMHDAFPNFDSFNSNKESLLIDLKLEARPKKEKSVSGDFVGAAVIHQESLTIRPATTIVVIEVDSLTDSGKSWNEKINPDGYTANRIAEGFFSYGFLSKAHEIAQRLKDKSVTAENGKVIRNELVKELTKKLELPIDKKAEIPSQRLRAIYTLWLGAPRLDQSEKIDWVLLGSKADIEGYKGKCTDEQSGNISFGMLSNAKKLIGDETVDTLDRFAKRAGLSTDEAYSAKVGHKYDVIGPFVTDEIGKRVFKKGTSRGNLSILLTSDGLRRNNPEKAKKIVIGKVDMLQPDPILLENEIDDSSYGFLNIGAYEA